jgi:hypothetical protein
VTDSQAACNGARACINAATQCSLQPRGAVQVDCNNTCQAPISGTCTGTTAGSCRDLDDPMDTVSCGVGECMSTVQRCSLGSPTSCTPGAPVVETCNTLDDDCDGTPDDGPAASLCPAAPFAASYDCSAGVCTFMCSSPRHDFNSTYSDGCECVDDSYGNTCATLTDLGGFGVGAGTTVSGTIVPDGESDWFSVTFANATRGPSNGDIRIALTGPTAGNFALDLTTSCGGGSVSCGIGSGTGIGTYRFVDNAGTGSPLYAGPHMVTWPGTIVFRVRRTLSTTNCAAASYTVTISR